jgi:hypothetical protein
LRKQPDPVENEEDSRPGVVNRDLPGRELLTSETHASHATVDGDVAEEATGAILHSDADLLVARSVFGTHIDDQVLQTSRLCYLPVYCNGVVWGLGEIEI